MFSNKYIFTYASVMVVIVAAVLSTAATLLKPFQEKNVMNERFQGILTAAEVRVSRSDASGFYSKHILEELAISSDGAVKARFANGEQTLGDVRPFDIVVRDEIRLKQDRQRGRDVREPIWPLFVMKKGDEKIYVVPLHGRGLWGPIWGNIAFKEDFNTVYGASFDHQSETPGLGAEINTDWFQAYFSGKQIFDQEGKFVSIRVVKGGVDNSPILNQHGVDGISGGTITSDGLTDMLANTLENYVEFIRKNKK